MEVKILATTIKAIKQITLESIQQYNDLIAKEEKTMPPQETPSIEIDINCRKKTQIIKIYAMLILADKMPWPDSQIIQKQINTLLNTASQEIKRELLPLLKKTKNIP